MVRKITNEVTKTDYQDGCTGYCKRILSEDIVLKGFPNYNHQILKAIAICIREINNDNGQVIKIYTHFLKCQDATVNVVATSKEGRKNE